MRRRTFLTWVGGTVLASTALRSVATPKERKKYKACIIGDSAQGDYGHSMHLAFALRDDVAVTALADPVEAGRERFGREAGVERTYADYREMLEKERPDLVAVGPRWTIHHKEYLSACAAVGAHGFMEKPLCVDLAEADAMVEAVRGKNLKWAIAYNMRVTPVMAALKEKIQGGFIGSVLEARGRGKEDHRAGGEDLVVLGTHVLDLMRYFMGDPLSCYAEVTHNGLPITPQDVREATEPLGPVVGNRLHAVYAFEKGTAGHFSSMISRDGGGGRWGLDLYGTRGIVSIRMEVISDVWWCDRTTWAPDSEGKAWKRIPDLPTVTMTEPDKERHVYLVDDLIRAIEEDREPQAGLNDGRWALEMVQGVFTSAVKGCKEPLPSRQREHPLKHWASA